INTKYYCAKKRKAEDKLKQIKEEIEKLEELKQLRERKLQEDQQTKEIEKLRKAIEQKAVQTTENIISNFVEEEISKVAQTELLILQTIEKNSDSQMEELIDETVKVLVEDVANEEYAHICFDQLLLNRYFTKWLMYIRKKKNSRKLIENTLSGFQQILERSSHYLLDI
ncbi:hypothetical protein EVAR_74171_1, partial [Eumeta japonica]